MPRIATPINTPAAEKADADFHKRHPQRKGNRLTNTATDAQQRAEWLELYKNHGGRVIGRVPAGGRRTSLAACVKSGRNLLEVYVYLVEMAGGEDPYGHTGLILQQKDKSYTRYSQAAENPKLQGWDRWEYAVWWQKVIVRITKFPKAAKPRTMAAGGKSIRIPTEHADQIQRAVDSYIADQSSYHVLTNNCADFVNDTINAAEDVSVPDATIPKDYFEGLKRLYPDCLAE